MSFTRNDPCTLCGEPEFHLNHMAFINNEVNRLPFHAYEPAPSQNKTALQIAGEIDAKPNQ